MGLVPSDFSPWRGIPNFLHQNRDKQGAWCRRSQISCGKTRMSFSSEQRLAGDLSTDFLPLEEIPNFL